LRFEISEVRFEKTEGKRADQLGCGEEGAKGEKVGRKSGGVGGKG
jgi:hypothetical protein